MPLESQIQTGESDPHNSLSLPVAIIKPKRSVVKCGAWCFNDIILVNNLEGDLARLELTKPGHINAVIIFLDSSLISCSPIGFPLWYMSKYLRPPAFIWLQYKTGCLLHPGAQSVTVRQASLNLNAICGAMKTRTILQSICKCLEKSP
jgi:hypothetical protein